MRAVRREEILDYVTWTEQRALELPKILEIKRRRRVHLGTELTFLFENTDTVRYQVQEMVRVERLVREADIQHELQTYNELLGGTGELICTLLIEIEDRADRAKKLVAWRDLPPHLYVLLADGRQVFAEFDPRQRDEERLSSVQFLRFKTGGQVPVAIGSALPALELEAKLDAEQRQALAEDLAG